MKKQDLIDSLANKFAIIGTAQLQDESEGFKYYLIGVWEIIGDTANRLNYTFYVKDEELPTEAAYWHGKEPKPTPSTSFSQDVFIYFKDLIDSDPDIYGGYIDDVINSQETAIGRLIRKSGQGAETLPIFIDKNSSDEFQYKEIF